MANSRPLPEAVRGCWYFLPPDFDLEEGMDQPHEMVVFQRDGTFERFEVDGDERERAEQGDYTFDGDFLIVRARKTNTYRVHRLAFWRWQLEAKKKERLLVRGIAAGDERRRLPDEELRDIQLLPLKARVETDFDGPKAIHRFVYTAGESDRRVLASFSIEDGDTARWVGLTPLVRGIEPKLWGRLVREAYLDAYLDGDHDVDAVDLHLLDTDKILHLEV